MINKCLGIVVGEISYKESSKIIEVLTLDYGLISLIATGAKKYNNKFSIGSKTLTACYFHFVYKKDKLSTLREIDLVSSYMNIKQDINKITYASYLTNLTKRVSKENFNSEMFNIYYDCLNKIESDFPLKEITLLAEYKYLKHLGIMPIIDCCSLCGNKNQVKTISVDDYGLICSSCYKEGYIFSSKTITIIQMFLSIDIKKLTKLNISVDIYNELDMFVSTYYNNHSGIYINKKKFVDILNKI